MTAGPQKCRKSLARPLQGSGLPQVTMDPSALSAANAPSVACTCWTFTSWSRTCELSPPESREPQVTTEPPSRTAANEPPEALICCTSCSWCWTWELSPPQSRSPQVTTDPSARRAAKALFVADISWTFVNWPWTQELSPRRLDSPMSQPSRLQGWRQRPLSPAFAAHSSAHLSLQSCLHRKMEGPMTPPIHHSRSQQTLHGIPEPAAHSASCLGPVNCRRPHRITPGHYWSICQDCGKCASCRLNVPHIFQIHIRGITTELRIAPGHHWTICQHGSKGAVRGLKLLNLQHWSWTAELSPPQSGSPQVTSFPPPLHQIAKALAEAITETSRAMAVKLSPSLTPAACRDSLGSVKTWPFSVTSRRNPGWNTAWPNSSSPRLWRRLQGKSVQRGHWAKWHWLESSNKTSCQSTKCCST